MAIAVPSTSARVTAEEFYALAGTSSDRVELVRGEIRAMSPTSVLHGRVVMTLGRLLDAYVTAHQLGWCFGEATGFRLTIPGDDAESVRAPDCAFVSFARLPALPETGFGPVAPDLAAEVLSPGQTAADILERLDDHFRAGTRLFWIVDPRAHRVTVHAPDAPTRWLDAGDTLDGGAVVPGLAIPVAELFVGLPPARPRGSDA